MQENLLLKILSLKVGTGTGQKEKDGVYLSPFELRGKVKESFFFFSFHFFFFPYQEFS